MKVALGSLALVVTLLALGAPAADAAAHRRVQPKCVPGHAHTIAANGRVQLFTALERGGGSTLVYGCAYGRRGTYALGLAPGPCVSPHGCGGVEHEVLAGPFVAYEESLFTLNEALQYVIVKDLRSGRVLHKVPTGSVLPQNGEFSSVGVGNVVAMVMNSDGATAWIADDEARSVGRGAAEVPFFDVESVGRQGSRLLASGTDVDPASLALAVDAGGVGEARRNVRASKVYWSQGGQSFSAGLD
jgi:hypothetical protein